LAFADFQPLFITPYCLIRIRFRHCQLSAAFQIIDIAAFTFSPLLFSSIISFRYFHIGYFLRFHAFISVSIFSLMFSPFHYFQMPDIDTPLLR